MRKFISNDLFYLGVISILMLTYAGMSGAFAI